MITMALCRTCQHKHKIDFDPVTGAGRQYSDWIVKHAGHSIEFRRPRRSKRDKMPPGDWERFIHNANVAPAYAATATPTLTLASLAASSTWLSGRESGVITNTYLDQLVAGNFKTAASNAQIGTIQVGVFTPRDDTPTYPDVFDGTDSAETVSLQSIYDQVVKVLASIATIATNALTYWFGMVAVAGLYGGNMPQKFSFFVSHNAQTTTNVWSATEGDHSVKLTGVFATVI